MNRRRLFIVLASLCLAITTAQSSELGKEVSDADAKLNATYQRALKAMPNDAARNAFKAAQRAWIAWRDGEVALSASIYEDGKTGTFMSLSLTQQRIKQLEAIAKRETEYGYDEKQ